MDFLGWLDGPHESTGISFLEESGEWQRYSFTDLAPTICSTSAALQARFPPGSHLLLVVPVSVQLFIAWYAATWAGLPPLVVASRGFESDEQFRERLLNTVARADCRAILVDSSSGGTVRSAVAEAEVDVIDIEACRGDDWAARRQSELAYLQMTSGTTGAGSILGVSPDALDANLEAIRQWLDTRHYDKAVTWLPWYHDLGLVGSMLNTTASQLESRYMTPEQFITRPRAWLDSFGTDQFTMTASPSFALRFSLRSLPDPLPKWDFTPWRILCLGGERIDPLAVVRFCRRLHERGFRTQSIMPAYGMAESTVCIAGSDVNRSPMMIDLDRLSSIDGAIASSNGHPGVVELSADDFDATEKLLSQGNWVMSNGPALNGITVGVEQWDDVGGEVVVRTPSAAVRLEGDRLTPLVDDDGVLRTGDYGFVYHGEVFITGRIGEACKVHGRMVSSDDVEYRLRTARPSLKFRGCVVMGSHLDGSQAVLLVLERVPDADVVERMMTICREAVGGQLPVTVIDHGDSSIPRTSSGKLRRTTLWRSFLEHDLNELVVSEL